MEIRREQGKILPSRSPTERAGAQAVRGYLARGGLAKQLPPGERQPRTVIPSYPLRRRWDQLARQRSRRLSQCQLHPLQPFAAGALGRQGATKRTQYFAGATP